MNTRVRRVLVSRVEIAGVVACILFLGVPAFAQKTPQQANPRVYTGASVDKNALSEEESREYASLVNDLQRKLDDAAQEFQRQVQRTPPTLDRNLSALVEDWFHTIDYVKAAQIERPLFLSDPLQMRVHLQVELKSKRIVRDDVVFFLSLQPRILY